MSAGSKSGIPASLHLQTIQALRGIAALSVILFHTFHQWYGHVRWPGEPVTIFGGGLPACGWIGVDIFFGISGFVIAWAHFKDIGRPEMSQRYALRRFLRIIPLYWVLVALKILSYSLLGSWGDDPASPGARVVNSIFFLPGSMVIGVAWTLSFEMLFYVLFGFAIVLPRQFAFAGLFLWIGGIFILPGLNLGAGHPLQFAWSPYNLEFLFGVLAAWIASRAPLSGGVLRSCLLLVTGVSMYAGYWQLCLGQGFVPMNEVPVLWDKLVFGAANCFIMLGLVGMERRGVLKVPSWIALVGAASYSIYLLHNEVLTVIAKAGNHFGIGSQGRSVVFYQCLMLASSLVAVGVGLLCHFFLELPLMARCRAMVARSCSPSTSGVHQA